MRWMWKLAAVAALVTVGAQAAQYQCYPKDEDLEQQWVTVSGSRARFEGVWLTRDPSYKPRLNKDYYRYDGYRGIFNNDGYGVDILIHKDMVKGARKSSLKVIARGEGYFNYYFNCYRRK